VWEAIATVRDNHGELAAPGHDVTAVAGDPARAWLQWILAVSVSRLSISIGAADHR
jgi:hypothetical protein